MMKTVEDRLSNLSDCVLLHILSFLEANRAVQTCVLSTRWTNLWKHLRTLRLSSRHTKSFKGSYSNLVSRILSVRDDSTALHTLDFIWEQDLEEPHTLKSIINYAVSHDLQQLRISIITRENRQFPPCLYTFQNLTSLDLSGDPYDIGTSNPVFPNSLIMPALTTLTIQNFFIRPDHDGCAEPFSAFKSLTTLTIHNCYFTGKTLSISSTTLVNLTLSGHIGNIYNLSIPSLSKFTFTAFPGNKLCGSSLTSVKHLYIDALIGSGYSAEDYSLVLLSWLLQFANITSLTISSSTLQVLSSVPDLFKVKLTSLCNLETLKVKMKVISPEAYIALGNAKSSQEGGSKFELKQSTFIPEGVLDFLLQNASSAKLHFIE